MTRKNAIPGVDEEALAALARQFPSGGTRAPDFSASTSTPAAPAPAPRAGGRGLAVFSLFVALIALAVGAVAIAGPLIRPWLVAKLGSHRLIDLATGYRADVDQRFSAVSSGIDGVKIELGAVGSRAASLERGASTMATRVGAVETGVEAAAKRLDALDGRAAAAAQKLDAAAARADSAEGTIKAADERIASNAAGLAAVAGRLDTVEGDTRTAGERLGIVAADLQASGERVDAFTAGLKTTTERVDAIEAVGGNATAAAGRIAALEKTLATLEQTDRGADKLLLGALQLRTALSGSRPYAKEVAAIRAVAGADPALAGPLAVLATHAENGVATVSQLRDSFASFVVPRLAVVASGDGRSLGARAEAWVGSFFSRAATPEERITNIVAQAERNLTHGHLSGAVDHLSQLDAAAAAAAATWMADARARLAVNAALSAVSARALDRFVAAN